MIDASYGWLLNESSELEVTCERGTSIRQDNIAYTELLKIHPALLGAITYLFRFSNQGSGDFAERISATTAYLTGCYVDLRPLGYEDAAYPLLCSVKKVGSSEFPGHFAVVAHNFHMEQSEDVELPLAHVNPEKVVYYPSTVIDAIWPHASKQVLIMEELGYSHDEILLALHNGIAPPGDTNTLNGLGFD